MERVVLNRRRAAADVLQAHYLDETGQIDEEKN